MTLGAEFLSPASERGTGSVKHGRSRQCGCGVDIQTLAELAESIMRPRSQYRGVDFCVSLASGVDFMGRNNFKILKSKSQNNRLRV